MRKQNWREKDSPLASMEWARDRGDELERDTKLLLYKHRQMTPLATFPDNAFIAMLIVP